MAPFYTLFGFKIPSYGTMVLLAVVAALVLALKRTPRKDRQDLLFMGLYALVGAMLGAKLLFVLTALPQLKANAALWRQDPKALLNFLFSGFVFYGGLIGGLGFAILYAKKYRVALLPLLDIAAPSLAIGHAIGRVGCFLAGCCYGRPMQPPWGVYFTGGLAAPTDVALFPVQLVEAGGNLLLGLGLLLYARKARPAGRVSLYYLLAYAVERFLLEYLRYDSIRGVALGLSTSQWISLGILAACAVLLASNSARRKMRAGAS